MVKVEDLFSNVSENSNKISCTLLPYSNIEKLRVDKVLESNEVYVFPENLTDIIYIYNVSGQLVLKLQPSDYKVNITSYLHPYAVYILKAGNRLNKIIY